MTAPPRKTVIIRPWLHGRGPDGEPHTVRQACDLRQQQLHRQSASHPGVTADLGAGS